MSEKTTLSRRPKAQRPMSGETSRPQKKSLAKRQQILDAAARALADQGYSEAKLSEIADEVGTHAGSLYYYFSSREELVRAVLLTSLERMSAQLAEGLDESEGLPPLERLQAFVRAVLTRRTSAKDDYLRAYMRNFNQVPPSIRRELSAKRHQVREALLRLVREAQAAGQISAEIDPGLVTLFIVGATNSVGLWHDSSGPNSPEEISSAFAELLMRGLLGAAAPQPASAARA
jgi:AcrR family transcriptional regulator